jgi:hypothetical protein
MALSLPASIDAALAAALQADALGRWPVMVLFTADPGAAALAALGLDGEGSRGQGELDHDAILAIAARGDVRSIFLLPALPQPSAPAAASSKLNPALQDAMRDHPEDRYPVIVTLAAPIADEALAALGLATVGDPTSAMGTLDRAQILAVAARADVLALHYMSPPQPSV